MNHRRFLSDFAESQYMIARPAVYGCCVVTRVCNATEMASCRDIDGSFGSFRKGSMCRPVRCGRRRRSGRDIQQIGDSCTRSGRVMERSSSASCHGFPPSEKGLNERVSFWPFGCLIRPAKLRKSSIHLL
jgi:hypothetical protein